MHENQTAAVDSYLRKLRDSDTSNKAFALKSLAFLVTQSRQQLTGVLEAVAAELEEALVVEENEVDVSATGLLEQLILHCEKQQIYSSVKRRLLRLVVRNLGDHKMQLRKMSHKCLVEFIKKYHDYDTLLYNYLREGIENNSQSLQLKQKCLNSLQSILIVENRWLDMSSLYTKRIFENIIDMVASEEVNDVQKAAQQCLLALCRLKGIKTLLGMISKEHFTKFGDVKTTNKQVADALAQNKKQQDEGPNIELNIADQQPQQHQTSTPMSGERQSNSRVHQNDYLLANGHFRRKEHSEQKSLEKQYKQLTNQDVAQAQEMLKRIEIYKNDSSILNEIDLYIPTLQNNFMNQRTQLFTISVRIIQVILDIRICQSRYYVRLVPSIVDRLNDQKFLIRNCINKMIKQYLVPHFITQKSYTKIWMENFFASLKKAVSANFKEDLINLLIYGYEMFYPIEYDRHDAVSILAKSAADKRKLIRSKAIECIVLVLQDVKRPDYETMLRRVISSDVFATVVQRLESGNIGPANKQKSSRVSIVIEDPLEYTFKGKRPRINTEQETVSNNFEQELSAEKKRYQSIRRPDRLATEEGPGRRTHLKKVISLQDQYTANLLKLDELTIQTNNPERFPVASDIKIMVMGSNSPTRNVKLLSDGIQYIEKDRLQALADPKKEVESLLNRLRDKSWKTQFEAVNTTRSLIEFHEEYLVSHNLPETVEQILKGVLSLRSSISKNSLMCLDELINKLKRRLENQADLIVEKVMKKTLYTNEFLQGEVRKCLNSISSSFSESKLMATLLNYRQHKSPNVKQNILIILENIIKSQRAYRKEMESIWSILLSMLDEPALEIREMAKKNIQLVLQLYPDCRTSLAKLLKKSDFDRVFELERKSVSKVKALTYQSPEKHVLEEKVNIQVDGPLANPCKVERSYTSPKKYSTGSAGSTSEFLRLQEIEKGCRNYKDWKNRINCILDIFKVAFRYSKEFCDYSNSARYITLLCEHLEDPNVKVCLNAFTVLEDSLIFLKPLVEDHLNNILVRILNGMANKKTEISGRCDQLYKKIKEKIDMHKLAKEMVKLCHNPLQKTRLMAIKQLEDLLYLLNRQSLSALTPCIGKALNRLIAEQKNVEVLECSRHAASALLQLGDRR